MTSGEQEQEQYQILMSPSAHRRYRKFDSHLQRKIKEEARKMSGDPYRYEELKGPLKGIRSYHFDKSEQENEFLDEIDAMMNHVNLLYTKISSYGI